jgi:hypothetical protein
MGNHLSSPSATLLVGVVFFFYKAAQKFAFGYNVKEENRPVCLKVVRLGD